MSFTSKKFWIDAVERAIKTFAQALLATLTVGVSISDITWLDSLGVAATATVISVLTSIASGGVGDPDTAGMVRLPDGTGPLDVPVTGHEAQ